MANQTVYPFGTDGQLPSSIGIINDLDTGGVNKALSAEQGKVIKKMLTGEWVVDPGGGGLEHYKDGYLLLADNTVIGSDIDDVSTYAQSGRQNIKILLSGYKKVEFYEFASSSGYGSLVIDADDKVLAAYTKTTGAWITTDIPEGAAYLVYSRSSTAQSKITLYGDSVIPDVQEDAIVASGKLIGNGNTTVEAYFPLKKGEYIHIGFPDGDWQTSEREDYWKLWLKLVNEEGNTKTEVDTAFSICKEQWAVPSYGYDFYASPRIVATFNHCYMRLRAASGTSVKYVITRLSKEQYKPYFSDEIADTEKKVKERQGSSSVTLGLITDMHYRGLEKPSWTQPPFAPWSPLAAILAIKGLGELVRLDNVVCLGDSIDGEQQYYRAMYDASDVSEFFSFTGVPLLYAVGNHDDNRYFAKMDGDRRLTKEEIYANFVQQVDERTTIGGAMNGCNYYRDIDRHKVRCIVLMSINFSGGYEFTSETRTWLTNTLDSMPEGYKALVFVHVPPPASHNWSTEGARTGGEATASILASNADKIICVFDGHLHLDNVYVKPYISVNVCSQKALNSTSGTNNPGSAAPEGAWWPVREVGTKNELLWDAVVINQEDGLLSCIRVGAGVDRYIHYTSVEVAAGGTTTLTPTAITVASWVVLDSEASAISIANGVVTVDDSATVGSRLMAKAVDASGNFEYWCIKVVAGN